MPNHGGMSRASKQSHSAIARDAQQEAFVAVARKAGLDPKAAQDWAAKISEALNRAVCAELRQRSES